MHDDLHVDKVWTNARDKSDNKWLRVELEICTMIHMWTKNKKVWSNAREKSNNKWL